MPCRQIRLQLACLGALSVHGVYADGHPLNDGQIAGIVVGSIVGGLLLICLAAYVARQCCFTAKSAQTNFSVYMVKGSDVEGGVSHAYLPGAEAAASRHSKQSTGTAAAANADPDASAASQDMNAAIEPNASNSFKMSRNGSGGRLPKRGIPVGKHAKGVVARFKDKNLQVSRSARVDPNEAFEPGSTLNVEMVEYQAMSASLSAVGGDAASGSGMWGHSTGPSMGLGTATVAHSGGGGGEGGPPLSKSSMLLRWLQCIEPPSNAVVTHNPFADTLPLLKHAAQGVVWSPMPRSVMSTPAASVMASEHCPSRAGGQTGSRNPAEEDGDAYPASLAHGSVGGKEALERASRTGIVFDALRDNPMYSHTGLQSSLATSQAASAAAAAAKKQGGRAVAADPGVAPMLPVSTPASAPAEGPFRPMGQQAALTAAANKPSAFAQAAHQQAAAGVVVSPASCASMPFAGTTLSGNHSSSGAWGASSGNSMAAVGGSSASGSTAWSGMPLGLASMPSPMASSTLSTSASTAAGIVGAGIGGARGGSERPNPGGLPGLGSAGGGITSIDSAGGLGKGDSPEAVAFSAAIEESLSRARSLREASVAARAAALQTAGSSAGSARGSTGVSRLSTNINLCPAAASGGGLFGDGRGVSLPTPASLGPGFDSAYESAAASHAGVGVGGGAVAGPNGAQAPARPRMLHELPPQLLAPVIENDAGAEISSSKKAAVLAEAMPAAGSASPLAPSPHTRLPEQHHLLAPHSSFVTHGSASAKLLAANGTGLYAAPSLLESQPSGMLVAPAMAVAASAEVPATSPAELAQPDQATAAAASQHKTVPQSLDVTGLSIVVSASLPLASATSAAAAALSSPSAFMSFPQADFADIGTIGQGRMQECTQLAGLQGGSGSVPTEQEQV